MDRYLARASRRHGWKAVMASFSWMHPAVGRIQPERTLRLLDSIDLQHKRNEEFAAQGLKGVAPLSREQEAEIFRKFDAVIAIQKEEAAEIRRMAPGVDVLTVGTSARPDRMLVPEPRAGRILYVGGYNSANIHGLRRFLDKSWPQILDACPEVRLRVCGHVHHAFEQGRQGVELCGYVDDLDEEYARSEMCVNPIWVGTGLKIKTVEALARACPLVTTSKGIEGIPEARNACAVSESEQGLADMVIELHRDQAKREALAQRARGYAQQHLSRAVVYRELLVFFVPRDFEPSPRVEALLGMRRPCAATWGQ